MAWRPKLDLPLDWGTPLISPPSVHSVNVCVTQKSSPRASRRCIRLAYLSEGLGTIRIGLGIAMGYRNRTGSRRAYVPPIHPFTRVSTNARMLSMFVDT